MKITSFFGNKKIPTILFSALLCAGISAPVQAEVTPFQKDIVTALVDISIDDFLDDEDLEDQQEALNDMSERGLLQDYPGITAVNASTIGNEYEKNEVKADLLYQNKWLLVLGNIEAIKKRNGQPFLILKDSSHLELPLTVSFKKSVKEIPTVAELHKGDSVKLVCSGGGLLFEAAEEKALTLQDCEFIGEVINPVREKLTNQILEALEGQGDKKTNASAVLTVLKVQQILGTEGEQECKESPDKCVEVVTNAMDQEEDVSTPKEFYDLGYTDEMLKDDKDAGSQDTESSAPAQQ